MIFISGTRDIRMENTAVAVGKFDGLHLGHQLLIDQINSYQKNGMLSVMFTFDYSPASLLKGQKPVLIYTSQERRLIAQRLGIDVLIEYPFNQETAHMEASDFVQDVLIGHLGARHIVVGEDFRFGNQAKGDAKLLLGMSMPLGYSAHICAKRCTVLTEDLLSYHAGEEVEISSTLIRDAISKGAMESANRMLGIPYRIIGEVLHGREIGHKMGMPTANLETDSAKLLPPNGVYASEVIVDRRKYPAVTNIGNNPTVAVNQEKRIETCIHGFDGNLYGRQLEVELYHFLRPEIKFPNLDALHNQIQKDQENALAYIERMEKENSAGGKL